MVVGVAIFFGVIWTMVGDNIKYDLDFSDPLIILDLLYFPVALIMSYIIPGRRVQAVAKSESLASKFNGYRSAMIVKYAIIEGSALFTIVVFKLTEQAIPAGVAILLLVILVILKPTPERFIFDLSLSSEEVEEFYSRT